MLSFFYIRFAWLLLDSSPSETDVMWGFSNLMAITPYALWWLTYGIFYILCILMVAGMLNKHLHGKHRINWFVALLFGCFYFQIKLNSANTDPKQSVQVSSSKQRLTYKKVIVWAIIGIVIMSFTTVGSKMFSQVGLTMYGDGHDVLANDAGFDYVGKQIYVDSSPLRTSMEAVATQCASDHDITLSLGCNVQNGQNFSIYISRVGEPSLYGIEVYSVAHEMLHTAYALLSFEDKKVLNEELLKSYEIVKLNNDEVTNRAIAPYIGEDQSLFLDELHSILVVHNYQLSSSLEKHYANYFKDRTILVEKYRASELVLINLEKSIVSYEASLKKFDDWYANNLPPIYRQRDDLAFYSRNGNYYAYNNLVDIYNKNVDLVDNNDARYEKTYSEYSTIYDSYVNMYSALRRNISYQEAVKTESASLQKAQ